jgi:hypothetical protein
MEKKNYKVFIKDKELTTNGNKMKETLNTLFIQHYIIDFVENETKKLKKEVIRKLKKRKDNGKKDSLMEFLKPQKCVKDKTSII